MYVYMGHMKFENIQPFEANFWTKNQIDLLNDRVQSVDHVNHRIVLEHGEELAYDKLVFATGSKPNFFQWKGQDLKGVQGLYSKQDLESMEHYTKGIKSAVVVGGGLIGIEMAEMLLSRGIEVHFLVRERKFWGSVLPEPEAQLIMKHLEKHHGLHMHYEEELEEIKGDLGGRAEKVITKKGSEFEAQFVGIAVGVHPNIEFLKDTGVETNRGILINNYLETSLEDCYAIGDCAELRSAQSGRRPLEQVWYTGRMMGEVLARNLGGERTEYLPGPWFNSAKFFDVEYQTYGLVPAKRPEEQESFVWQHPKEDFLLHLVFDREGKIFRGINTFGIRLRHELFDQWLREERTVEYVLEHLASANFDPEFYRHYEAEVIARFNQQFETQITLKKAMWWRKMLQAVN